MFPQIPCRSQRTVHVDYDSVGPVSSTHPFISSFGFNQMSPPLWERQGSLAFWSSEASSFLGHFSSNASACHIPDPPPAQPPWQPPSLLFSPSPIRQPHQNCKLGYLWGSTSHYEQLIKFHTKTQNTPNTSSWRNPTEQTKDKLSNSTKKDKKQNSHWGSDSWNFLALTYPTNTKLVALRNTLRRCKLKNKSQAQKDSYFTIHCGRTKCF